MQVVGHIVLSTLVGGSHSQILAIRLNPVSLISAIAYGVSISTRPLQYAMRLRESISRFHRTVVALLCTAESNEINIRPFVALIVEHQSYPNE